MREQPGPQEIDLERNLETRRLNIDLALRRCQRKGWQPRDYFLRATAPIREIPEIADIAKVVQEKLRSYPDVDWSTAERTAIGDEVFILAKPLLEAEFEQGRGNIQPAEHWQSAGLLGYELYNPKAEPPMPELGTDALLIVHLPTQAEGLSREQWQSSLKEIAGVVNAHPELKGIWGASLLLEHPLLQRFGFRIDEQHDDGLRPVSFIGREEFLKLFGK